LELLILYAEIMSAEEFQSKDVARVLERTFVRAIKMPLEEVVPALDEAEAFCLSRTTPEDLRLEVKRRVVELKVRLFCDRNASFELVEKLHKDILNLGYTNLEIEGTIEICFAMFYMRQNHLDIARQTLTRLLFKLKNSLNENNQEIYPELSEKTEKLLSQILDEE